MLGRDRLKRHFETRDPTESFADGRLEARKIGLEDGFVIHHRAGERERGAEEGGDFSRRTNGVLSGSQLRTDFIKLDGLLGEHCLAGAFLPIGHGFPLVVELLFLRAEIFVESRQNGVGLFASLATQQQTLEHGFDDLLAVHGHRHGDAKGVADGLVLAEQDIKDDAVNLIVRAVIGQDADFLFFIGLAEAVHAAVALLVTGRVPRQIVVNDGVELFLEVDAFAQAVGADENAGTTIVAAQSFDSGGSLLGWELAGDASDLHFLEPGAQFRRDVFRCLDEAAKDDRLEAITEQRLETREKFGEFVVFVPAEFSGFAGEGEQPAAHGIVALRFGVSARHHVRGFVTEVFRNIEDRLAAEFVGGSCITRLQHIGTLRQRCGRRRRTTGHRAKERKGRPPADPLMKRAAGSIGDGLTGVIKHPLEKCFVSRAEFVVCFGVLTLGKRRVALKKVAQVSASALDKMRRESAAVDRLVRATEIIRQVFEIGRKQGEQGTERAFIATVGRGGDEHEMPLRLFGELRQEFMALMRGTPALGRRRARVGFVHDDEVRAGPQKVMTSSVRLDEVHRDYDERMRVEDGLVRAQILFKTARCARKHQFNRDVEFGREFLLPLLGKVRRTQHAQPGDLASVEHFARNQTSLDGFADAHIIRDEQPYGIEFERHQERHELIGAGLYGEPTEGTKRSGAGAETETHRITQQTTRDEITEIVLSRWRKGGRGDGLQDGMDAGGFLNRAAQRTDDQEIILRFWQDNPFSSARLDESSRSETHWPPPVVPNLPKTLGYWATTDAQSVARWKRMTVMPSALSVAFWAVSRVWRSGKSCGGPST